MIFNVSCSEYKSEKKDVLLFVICLKIKNFMSLQELLIRTGYYLYEDKIKTISCCSNLMVFIKRIIIQFPGTIQYCKLIIKDIICNRKCQG